MTEEANPKPEAAESQEVKPAEGDKPAAAAAPGDEAAKPAADGAPEKPAPAEEKPAAEAKSEAPAEEKPAPEAKADEKPETPPPANDAAKPEEPKPDPTEPLRTEIAELKDRLLRLAADMENQRRRQDREMADAKQYAVTAFSRELLAVSDNLSRALAAYPTEKRTSGDPIDNLLSGVEVTDRELQRVFEKFGVRKFGQAGEKFDPNRHQAIYEVPDGSVTPGTIAQVVQSGYSIGERVLRPALVAVASAPKTSPADAKESSSEPKS